MVERSGRRPLPWALIMGGLLILSLAGGTVYLVHRGVSETLAMRSWPHGTVGVDSCRKFGRGNNLTCHGDFRSDAGDLAVPDVAYDMVGVEYLTDYGARHGARVSGRDARTAVLDGGVSEQAVPLTLAAALLTWLIAQSVWFARAVRRRTGSRRS